MWIIIGTLVFFNYTYSSNTLQKADYLRGSDKIVEICQLQHTAEVSRHISWRKVVIVYFSDVK